MEVLVIPTNKPISRLDNADKVYKTTRAKYGAIIQEVIQKHELGQPVLIGTRSIDHNEIISNYLKRKKIPHQVLNAKNHEKEAQILSDAGRKGAVTVATNIAGRGVDIMLGGTAPDKKDKEALKQWKKEHQEVIKLGGLHVIGSERHESRRIDNQLRGRSGRQGDPGSSRFFVALDDEIMRIFGGEAVAKVMDALKIPEDQPIEAGLVSRSIEQAQMKVEGFHFDQRKRLVEFDDVMNKQREIIYKRRQKILENSESNSESSELKDRILDIISSQIQNIVISRTANDISEEEIDFIIREFSEIIPFDTDSQKMLKTKLADQEPDEMIETLNDIVEKTYSDRESQLGNEAMRQIERFSLLTSIDNLWMEHIDAIDDLREGIWMRGDKQTVLSEYKKEAFGMFESLIQNIDSEVARRIFRIHAAQSPHPVVPLDSIETKKESIRDLPVKETKPRRQTSADFASALANTASKSGELNYERQIVIGKVESGKPKIGRNDTCPCGSGKKWKKCHMNK